MKHPVRKFTVPKKWGFILQNQFAIECIPFFTNALRVHGLTSGDTIECLGFERHIRADKFVAWSLLNCTLVEQRLKRFSCILVQYD